MITEKLQQLQPADLARLLQGAWVRHAALAVNAVLVVWIAWMLAMLTWDILDGSVVEEPAPGVAATPAVARPDPAAEMIRQIPDWHMFGEARPEVVKVKPAVPADAPDTRLKLVLRGAFASDDRELARAIIADPRGKEEHYSVGDTVPGNAELSEIHPDRVILRRGGRYETLRLPEDARGGGRLAASGRAGTVSASRSGTAQRLKSLRSQLRKNPKSLYGLVRATPKKDEQGKMVGYTLQPGRDPALFKQMGLQNGDVVKAINDIALDSLANGMKALKSAQAGQTVEMVVLRGGAEENLSFDMPQ